MNKYQVIVKNGPVPNVAIIEAANPREARRIMREKAYPDRKALPTGSMTIKLG